MRHIDEIIEKIVGKIGKNIVFGIFIFICSITCLFLTQNVWLAFIYTIITFGFDILAKNYEEFSLVTLINWIFGHKVFVYVLLIIIALLPTFVYGVEEAITSSGMSFGFIKYVFVERLYNLVPNIFGALIVCSFMHYLSGIGAEKILCATMRKKKDFFDIFMRGGFIIAFLNAINHAFRNGYRIPEWCNAFHLTVVIFGGIVILGAYALWIIDNNDFNLETANVYPRFSLTLCAAFLWSCVFIPVKLNNVETEWLLLFFNGVTSIIVSWAFLIFIRRKLNKKWRKYPYTKLSIFTVAVLFIIKYGIDNMGIINKNTIIIQLISGCIILLGTIVLLYLMDDFQKKNYNYKGKHLDLEKLKEKLSVKQKDFLNNVESGLGFDYDESSAINDLLIMIELKTKIKTLEKNSEIESCCSYYNAEQGSCEKNRDNCTEHEEKCENANEKLK